VPATLDLFAACLPGLEPLLADELRRLGTEPTTVPGGAAFAGDVALLRRAHLGLGVASHLLLRCGAFTCRHLGELRRKIAPLPFGEWLRADRPFAVRATASRSRLYHTGAIAQRVGQGIADALGVLPPAAETGGEVPADAPMVAVRVANDRVTLSLDTSATPLHRRGYRLAGAKAPLREDLARALLLAGDIEAGDAVLDPFCGAGTIAIEAALLRAGLPPGRLRPPPLQGTALQDDAAWAALVAAAPAPPAAGGPALVHAGDRDAGAMAAAADNAERAGVRALLELRCCAFTSWDWFAKPTTAPARGVVVTNPPFGRRIGGGRDLAPLYQTLGHRLNQLGPGWRLLLLAADARLARRTGVPLRQLFATRHGGAAVAALGSADGC
jgi:putative N6-adenine-specific DNA methylase